MERKKLLIADDSEMNRAILANMLEQDFEIMEVSDGKEALAALQIYRKDLSALLLDIVMPGMDGFQVLEEMKQRQWLEDVPTVMISAETGSSYIDQAFELGAADYINRPFATGIIRRRIINTILLHTKKQQLMDIVSNYFYRHKKTTEEMVSILSSAVEHRCCGGGRHMAGVGYLTGLLLRLLLGLLLPVCLRILDRIIGCIDLVHFLCSGRIAWIQIRVIFLCQTAIGLTDLILRCIR